MQVNYFNDILNNGLCDILLFKVQICDFFYKIIQNYTDHLT